MGHKTFVSYKYADTNVAALAGSVFYAGEPSCIFAVPWDTFFKNVVANIDRALRIQTDSSSCKITKTVSFDY